MKIPEGMTEDEVLNIIMKVARRYKKYSFAYYTPEDIEQECIIFGIEALEKYTSGSLENFLAIHIRNRLLNLKRQKISRTVKESNKFDKIKRIIIEPLDISNIDDERESRMFFESFTLKKITYQELLDIINTELSVSDRLYFLRMLDGQLIQKPHREKIIEKIRLIIEKYDQLD